MHLIVYTFLRLSMYRLILSLKDSHLFTYFSNPSVTSSACTVGSLFQSHPPFIPQIENTNENFDQTLADTLFVQSPLESVDTRRVKKRNRGRTRPGSLFKTLEILPVKTTTCPSYPVKHSWLPEWNYFPFVEWKRFCWFLLCFYRYRFRVICECFAEGGSPGLASEVLRGGLLKCEQIRREPTSKILVIHLCGYVSQRLKGVPIKERDLCVKYDKKIINMGNAFLCAVSRQWKVQSRMTIIRQYKLVLIFFQCCQKLMSIN